MKCIPESHYQKCLSRNDRCRLAVILFLFGAKNMYLYTDQYLTTCRSHTEMRTNQYKGTVDLLHCCMSQPRFHLVISQCYL